MNKRITTIILVVILIIGLSLLLYPSFSDYWNKFHQSRAVASYTETVANIESDEYEEIWTEAEAYNHDLAGTGMRWVMTDEEIAQYEETLAVGASGMMAYIDIPKINCCLPIYHGISEAVLQTSIGHLAGTSLPVGGKNTHCVLSGHRGLPSAKLFSDLDELVEGDEFMIRTLDEVLTYEVDQIRVVEPSNLTDLTIEWNKDYCTLVTCTPYGLNTHRLLVRGHRVKTEEREETRVAADAIQLETIVVAPFMAAPMILLLLILLLIITGRQKRKNKKAEHSRTKQEAQIIQGEDADGD